MVSGVIDHFNKTTLRINMNYVYKHILSFPKLTTRFKLTLGPAGIAWCFGRR